MRVDLSIAKALRANCSLLFDLYGMKKSKSIA